MKSLEILEELNKILIDAEKRCSITYNNVGEMDKERGDLEHDILNTFNELSAKEKRLKLEELYDILVERHNRKYEYRELEILADLYSLSGIKNAINTAINKLRKLNTEIEQPIYHTRAKKNNGKIVIVEKDK